MKKQKSQKHELQEAEFYDDLENLFNVITLDKNIQKCRIGMKLAKNHFGTSDRPKIILEHRISGIVR